MENTIRKAICVMLIGEKYVEQFKCVKSMYEAYAKKCSASLHVINTAPDPDYHRPITAQKLLIPQLTLNYDLVLFMDSDILISCGAPDIFAELPDDKSFGAILDMRNTDEFVKTWDKDARIINETNLSYFTSRNFEAPDNLSGSINGGVLLFRPAKVATIFSNYYYSDHNQGPFDSFEETPMAYYTQINNLFHPLDSRYNLQIMYKLKGTQAGNEIIRKEKRIPKFIRRYYYKRNQCKFVPIISYKKLVSKLLEDCYFLHLAGGYPFYIHPGISIINN